MIGAVRFHDKRVNPAPVDEQSLNKLQADNAAMQKQLDTIYAALSISAPTYNSVTDGKDLSISFAWIIAWILIFFVAGALAGWKWFDWVHVKRHGGFRL